MSYVLTLTDGSVLTTIQDGTLQSNIGITLIGRNVPSYGNIQNRNFIKLTENFADSIPPTLSSQAFTPLRGTLWYDTANKKIRVYDTGSWNPVSEMTSANAAPSVKKTGDQWWDTITNQLNVWTGNTWQLVGPVYSSIQSKTGSFAETIFDFQFIPQPHLVQNSYVANVLVAITSVDPTFAADPVAQAGFGQIVPGINVSNAYVINGTATNSNQLANVAASGYARRDISTTFENDVRVNGILTVGNANVQYQLNALNIQNTEYLGDINFFMNTPSGNISGLQVSGTSGLVSVYGDPVAPNHVANKNYVDTLNTSAVGLITTETSVRTAQDIVLRNEYTSLINGAIVQITTDWTANAVAQTVQINNLTASTTNSINTLTANAGTQGAAITSINNTLATKADLASPIFTGTPRAPLASPFSNNDIIATTQYVDNAITTLSNNTGIGISDEVAARNAAIAAAVAPLAPKNNPVFTGVPRAPTAIAGNNSTMIATTQFVNTAILAQKFNYTVASSPPSGGNDGDFWFQVG
jgi:hypothetical protein